MASKKLTWAILGHCGSLLTMAGPTLTQASDPPAKQAAKPSTKQDQVTCRYLDSEGGRIRQRVCGTPVELQSRVRLVPVLFHPFPVRARRPGDKESRG